MLPRERALGVVHRVSGIVDGPGHAFPRSFAGRRLRWIGHLIPLVAAFRIHDVPSFATGQTSLAVRTSTLGSSELPDGDAPQLRRSMRVLPDRGSGRSVAILRRPSLEVARPGGVIG